jgi:hypothetical protein
MLDAPPGKRVGGGRLIVVNSASDSAALTSKDVALGILVRLTTKRREADTPQNNWLNWTKCA